jgi:hypothetical protein
MIRAIAIAIACLLCAPAIAQEQAAASFEPAVSRSLYNFVAKNGHAWVDESSSGKEYTFVASPSTDCTDLKVRTHLKNHIDDSGEVMTIIARCYVLYKSAGSRVAIKTNFKYFLLSQSGSFTPSGFDESVVFFEGRALQTDYDSIGHMIKDALLSVFKQ